MFLLLDNYDSFTYNLQDYFAQLKMDCTVFRNDEKTLEEIIALRPQAIIFSPGPETPSKAGIMMQLIRYYHDKIPLLGICLGHQGIGEFFGARLVQSPLPMHGKTSFVHHSNHPVFENIPNPFEAMRYHSLILNEVNHPFIEVIATTDRREVMAIAHRKLPICGIQFHPESILTPHGLQMLTNWIKWSILKTS